MNIILNIQGGLGKNILATALVQGIKKRYPNSYLIVISGYTDVFLNNPMVNKCLKHNEQKEIYKKFIKSYETLFFIIDPYMTSDFQNGKGHLLNIWFELCGLKYKNEQPQFFLSKVEKQFYSNAYKHDKPILAIQPNGGASNQNMHYNWARDIPQDLVNKIINKFKKDYDIVHIKRADQINFTNTKQALDGFRSIAYLLSISSKCLLIDSFAQHLAKSVNKKSVVLWSATTPEMFGYESHINIKANKHTKEPLYNHGHYKEFELVEAIENCPYQDLSEIFDYNLVYNKLNSYN
jgi:ADP-heptose:LPS heptosyltransferase